MEGDGEGGEEEKASRPLNVGHPSFAEGAKALSRNAQIFKGLKGHVKRRKPAKESTSQTRC